jgi:serine/threonine protein kinase
VIDAMDYCHKDGIIHRDLKLENILLKEKGKLDIKVNTPTPLCLSFYIDY